MGLGGGAGLEEDLRADLLGAAVAGARAIIWSKR